MRLALLLTVFLAKVTQADPAAPQAARLGELWEKGGRREGAAVRLYFSFQEH